MKHDSYNAPDATAPGSSVLNKDGPIEAVAEAKMGVRSTDGSSVLNKDGPIEATAQKPLPETGFQSSVLNKDGPIEAES